MAAIQLSQSKCMHFYSEVSYSDFSGTYFPAGLNLPKLGSYLLDTYHERIAIFKISDTFIFIARERCLWNSLPQMKNKLAAHSMEKVGQEAFSPFLTTLEVIDIQ